MSVNAKPLAGTRLRQGHPDLVGLAAAVPLYEGCGAPRNLVTGGFATGGSVPAIWTPTTGGMSLRNPTANNANTHYTFPLPSFSESAFSLEAWVIGGPNTDAFYDKVCQFDVSTGIQQMPSAGSYMGYSNNAGSTPTVTPSNGTLNHVVAVGYPTIFYTYINGVQTQSFATTNTATANQLILFALGTNQAFNGSLVQVNAWSRPLSFAAIQRRFQHPWDMYESPRRRAIWAGALLTRLLTGTDSAAETDMVAILGIRPVTIDGSSLTDSPSLAAASPATDAGTATDTPSLAAASPATDAGTATDTPSLAAAIALADAAAASELLSLAVSTSIVDASVLSDSVTSAATLAAADSSSLADAPSVAAAWSIADSVISTDSSNLDRHLPTHLYSFVVVASGHPDSRWTKVV